MIRVFAGTSFTPTATADTSNLSNGTFMAMKGGSATMRFAIEELYMGGQAGASSVNDMTLALDSQLGSTPTALAAPFSDRALDGSSVGPATAVVSYTSQSGANQPQRLAQGYLLTPSFNSFGGVVRLNYSNTQARPVVLGNAASTGEISLSAKNDTGTAGLISAHIMYEPF